MPVRMAGNTKFGDQLNSSRKSYKIRFSNWGETGPQGGQLDEIQSEYIAIEF